MDQIAVEEDFVLVLPHLCRILRVSVFLIEDPVELVKPLAIRTPERPAVPSPIFQRGPSVSGIL